MLLPQVQGFLAELGQLATPAPGWQLIRRSVLSYVADEDWQKVWEPAKNAHYYWNRISGEVTWMAPASFQAPSRTPPYLHQRSPTRLMQEAEAAEPAAAAEEKAQVLYRSREGTVL